MADKSVGELIAAKSVTPTDLFVLEQNGTAKKLTGQILENWLVSFADGHGGIQSFDHVGTSGLVDTYRITMADTTTFDFDVNNGRGINTIKKTGTSGLVDTYTINFNDATSSTFEVANGAKGDKGDNAYTHIKYASQKPTASSHSMGDVADNWIGIYYGASATAPTDWTEYEWFQIKGEKGDTGEPATLTGSAVEYQVSDSGTIVPSGAWSASVPVVAQGKYLWTRTTQTFNTGSPVISYSVSRMGIDGSGSVSSVAGVSPDENGNVPLTAEDFGALSINGGVLNGGLNMNGQKLRGLNAPTENDEAATKGYVDNAKPNMTGYATETYVNSAVKKAAPRNLLDNSDFSNPVNQRGGTSYTPPIASYWLDKWTSYGKGTEFALTNKKLTISNNGTATCGLFQRIQAEYLTVGKTYTLAVKGKVAGTWYLTYGVKGDANSYNSDPLDNGVDKVHVFCFALVESTDGLYNFRFRSPNVVATAEIEWMALYEGEYTTETLPEYRPKGKQVEALNCGAIPGPIDLLWENASPTSDFAAQTVAVDLSLYNWVLIETNFSNEHSERTTMLAPNIVGNTYSIMMNRASSTVARRFFTLAETGIDFANGASGSSNGEKYMIPTKPDRGED